MSKKKYNRRNRYSKKKRYTKRKKKTLKKRGGSGTLKGSDVVRLTEPLHLYSKNYLQTNVLNRIYGGNAVALNNELREEIKRVTEPCDSEISKLNKQLEEANEKLTSLKKQMDAMEPGDEKDKLEDRIERMSGRPISLDAKIRLTRRKMEGTFEYTNLRLKSRLPKLLSINGHGLKSNTLTLIPEGMELYLTTGGGQSNYGNIEIAEKKYKQIFGSSRYIRLYTGLIQDYVIDFNLVYEGTVLGEGEHAFIECEKSGIFQVQPGVYQGEGILDEKQFIISMMSYFDEFELPFLEYQSATTVSDPEDQRINHYINNMLQKHDINIISRELMKYFMFSNIRPPEERSFVLKLSHVLQFIEAKSNELDLPNKILGMFCRSGDLPTLDIDSFRGFSHEELPALTDEYFNVSIFYEGTNLTRQKSPASIQKVQDFWNIYHNVIKNIYSLPQGVQAKVRDIQREIERRNDILRSLHSVRVYRGIELHVQDACLIFQCDNFFIKPEEERVRWLSERATKDYSKAILESQEKGYSLAYGGGK